MDILSRLKTYMESKKITSSQFADTCNISRPTLSQILTGRNKKISDELISKIHAGYPTLNILWLMFGEGDMTSGENFETSEPQNSSKSLFDEMQVAEHEIFNPTNIQFEDVEENDAENSAAHFSLSNDPKPTISTRVAADIASAPKEVTQHLNGKTESGKSITSIVVFYADNTFQTFTPY